MADPTESIPVTIVGGYLGSGKTTYINARLRAATTPIAVLVNDFGSVNIDAALIASEHGDTIELTNGCACCLIGDSLADALDDVRARSQVPAEIIVEASGVADPASVAGYAHRQGLQLGAILVMVDATTIRARHRDERLTRTIEIQIAAATQLRITKSDLVSADALAELDTWLDSQRNSRAQIVTQDLEHPDHADVHITEILEFPSGQEGRVRNFVESLAGHVVRAKGIARLEDGSCVLVQRVGDSTELSPTDLPPTGLVVIRLTE